MTKVLIVGAHGRIAQVVTRQLLEHSDVVLTLFLRQARRLDDLSHHPLVTVAQGDATDPAALVSAMAGQDVVYANLSGDLPRCAKAITAAMKRTGLHRLIFVSSMGIYGEVPGQPYRSILDPYRDSAAFVEDSGLDVTVIRPAWLNDENIVSYGTTRKGEPFRNPDASVSRASVADLIAKLITKPAFGIGESFGVHRLP